MLHCSGRTARTQGAPPPVVFQGSIESGNVCAVVGETFFSEHPFFRTEEFVAAYVAAGHTSSAAAKVLEKAVRSGRLFPLRRGLYANEEGAWEPWILASKLAPDPLFAYDGALSLHGLTGVEYSLAIATADGGPRFVYADVIYNVVTHPLPAANALDRTQVQHRYDQELRVTTLARTLVDCLDRVHLGRPLGDLFEMFASQPDLDVNLDEVVAHVEALGSASTAARVSVFLWAHPKWRIRTHFLHRLHPLLPKHTVYADPHRAEDGQQISRFKIIIPEELALAIARFP